MEDHNIDYAITGESDFQFATLVNALLNNQRPESIKGLVYRKKENVVVIQDHFEKVDVRQLPHPARYLVNMDGYCKIGLFHSTRARSERVLSVMASRVCPGKCSFCTTPMMQGNKVRPLQNLPKIVTSGRVLKTLSHCDNRHD